MSATTIAIGIGIEETDLALGNVEATEIETVVEAGGGTSHETETANMLGKEMAAEVGLGEGKREEIETRIAARTETTEDLGAACEGEKTGSEIAIGNGNDREKRMRIGGVAVRGEIQHEV